MVNIVLAAAPGASFKLQNINLSISKGTIVMILGPVGSGKSTLLKAMLGELACTSGHVRIDHRKVAYCSQSPWIPNGTIRQIICGPSNVADIDQQWYDTTIHVCALEEDIAQLPQSHDTVVGSRGVKLSGGQKQRLVCTMSYWFSPFSQYSGFGTSGVCPVRDSHLGRYSQRP